MTIIDKKTHLDNATKLLKTIGSPFIKEEHYNPSKEEIKQLYHYARKNRMGYYFLHVLHERGILPQALREEYNRETQRYNKILEAMTQVSKDLEEEGIEHAIYKSIRPYPSTTVDIDIIIYGDYEKAYLALRRRGYPLLGLGPETITLQDPAGTVGIDLYREIAVSRIIYLDKWKLRSHKTKIKLSAGYVTTLTPEADIIAVVAHLAVKEQIFTLADYYTILHHLKHVNPNIIYKLARETKTETPLHFTLTLTTILHQKAHNKPPIPHEHITNIIYDEARKLMNGQVELPIKMGPKTLTSIFIEKLVRDEKARKSIAVQAKYLTRRSYLRFFMEQLISHITRETY